MGLTICLEGEDGTKIDDVGDPRQLLSGLLPPWEDRTSRCLRYVDPYGDTVFNKLQMEDLLEELKGMSAEARPGEEKQLVKRITELAQRCQAGVGLHLKFYGD